MKNLLHIYFTAAAIFFFCCGKDSIDIEYLPFEMVEIPAGSFLTGSDKGYVLNETPRRTVNLSGFLMSKYEITQHQYFTIMNESPSFTDCGNCPVEQVSWYDAVRFCNELSEIENLGPAYIIRDDTVIWDRTAEGYRLPTEVEWEYACKAGTDTDFFTGDISSFDFQLIDSALQIMGWYSVNSNNRAQPAGRKQANAFGLFDMHGNVWEWCWDYFNEERYFFMEDPSDDPVDERYSADRVIRGGSFFNDALTPVPLCGTMRRRILETGLSASGWRATNRFGLER